MANAPAGLVLLVVVSTCTATLLWRIETSPPSYIFGTIHIPYDLVWSHVSNTTRAAFESSTHYYSEIDAKNETYWDEFYQCLLNRSTRRERSMAALAEGDLLDIHLADEARRLNKTVGSLESPEYHCQREAWRYSLKTWKLVLNAVKQQMRNRTRSIVDFSDHFNRSTIQKYICDEMDGDFIETLFHSAEEVKQMEHRDEHMSRLMRRLLRQRSSRNRYFFAVGAAHVLGKHKNLIVRLKTFGYRVTRVCTEQNRVRRKAGCKKKKTVAKHCAKRKSPKKSKQ